MVAVSLKKIFFKQKTAYEIEASDWSSDVCSSDLADIKVSTGSAAMGSMGGNGYTVNIIGDDSDKIGRASCRERV